MKTENIKPWDEALNSQITDGQVVTTLDIREAMMAEIDELRAALKERDAEKAEQHECYQRVCREYHAQRAVMQQALDGFESMIGRKPERIDQVITALKEALK